MFVTRTDKLLLKLFWLALRNRLRELGLADRVFFLCGGILCLLWPLNDLTDLLRQHGAWLRNSHWVWELALGMFLLLGFGVGRFSAGWAIAHANASYLRVQPLSEQARRRMAGFASLIGSLWSAPAAFVSLAMVCEVIHQPDALLWGCGAASAYLVGAGFGLATRLRAVWQVSDAVHARQAMRLFQVPFIPGFRLIDRASPAWLSSWSIGLVAGRLPLTVGRLLGFSIILLGAALPSVASLGSHQGGPAAAAAVLSGFAAFMLLVRSHPLGSPVLRSAPIGFMKAWFGVLRLPLVLSFAFFVVPAGAAFAAEPSSWAMPASGCFGLFVLDGVYAVFAAFFLASPLLAAISFFVVVLYACYEWVTYHAVVYAGFAGLLLLMWTRIRRSFYRGC